MYAIPLYSRVLLLPLSLAREVQVNAEPHSARVCRPVANAIQTFVAAASALPLNPQEQLVLCLRDSSCSQNAVLNVEIASYRFVCFSFKIDEVHHMLEYFYRDS